MIATKTIDPAPTMPTEAPVEALPPALLRTGRGVIYAAILLGPLVTLPPSTLLYNALDTPRRLVLFFLAGLLAALIAKAWAERGRLAWRRHPLDLPVLLFFLGGVLSGIGGAYPHISLFGPLWSQDGLLLLLIGVLLYAGAKEFLREPKEIELGAVLLVATGGLVSVIGLLDRFMVLTHLFKLVLNPAFTGWRFIGTLGNSMFTGTYLAMLIPLGVGVAFATRCWKRRTLVLASVGVMLPSLLFTMARAAWIGFALTLPVLLVLLVLHLRRARHRLAVPVLVISLLALGSVLLLGLTTPMLRDRLRSVVNMEDATIQTRAVYMHGALNMFLARPVQGWGMGNLKLVFPQFRPFSHVVEQRIPLNRGFSTSQPHNLPLQIAAEMGLLGLLPFLLLVGVIYWTCARQFKASPWQAMMSLGLLGLFTAYFISNLFAFDNAATMAQFWLALGVLATLGAQESALLPRMTAPPFQPWLRSLLSIASLLVAMGFTLNTGMQCLAARCAQNGVVKNGEVVGLFNASLSMPDAEAEQTRAKALRISKEAINSFQVAIRMTPIPTLHGIIYGDFICYEGLFYAYRGRTYLAPGSAAYLKEARPMWAAGRQVLKRVDRDPYILRYMIMDFTNWGNMGFKLQLAEARTLAKNLLRFEPNSAEVKVIYADILEAEGDIEESANQLTQAVTLDPTFAVAWARLGRYQSMLYQWYAEQRNPIAEDYIAMACESYGNAERLGLRLDDVDQNAYATGLFLLKREDDGIAAGNKLQDPNARKDLIERVKIIYQTYQLQAALPKVLQALEVKKVAPAPAPPPMPVAPVAPNTPIAPVPLTGPLREIVQ